MTSASLNIPQAMQSALRHYQAGDLQEAEKICRSILLTDADCAVANHFLGVVAHRQGRSDEGIACVRKALEIDPAVADAHNNLGNILKDIGRLDEAVDSFRQAIKLLPDFATAHYNLGMAFRHSGQSDLAVRSYRRALELEPKNPAIHNNLGNVLKDLGRLDEAISCYAKAVNLNPGVAEAHFNLAEVLRRRGADGAALTSYVNALQEKPGHIASIHGMGRLLEGRTFAGVIGEAVPQLREILMDCLERDEVEHQDFYHAAMDILLTPDIVTAIESFVTNVGDDLTDSSFFRDASLVRLLKDPLFALVLRRTTVVHQGIEKFLTAIRRSSLSALVEPHAVDPDVVAALARFVYPLASQCYTGEYVYAVSAKEAELVTGLIAGIGEQMTAGDESADFRLAVLACYEPLSTIDFVDDLTDSVPNPQLADLVVMQVREPARVRAIAERIDSLSAIDDAVSRDVRRQYEENPYPPWTGTYAGKPSSFAECLATNIYPCDAPEDIGVDNPAILIAGCGTGKHAIDSACRYAGCSVLAIDLSRQSIAYGKRKAQQLGVENIEFLHADILDLGNLDRQFDVIESVGVLHHMGEPLKGLAILVHLLKGGGFLKLGLYSSLARQDVEAVRRFVAEQGFDASPDDIRKCRQAIFDLPANDLARTVTQSIDFYSMSAARDFLFHVQEHVFTLPEISVALREKGLDFLGFVINAVTMQNYQSRFPQSGSFLSLENWDRYEQEYPHTFAAMYQFWTRKSL